MMDSSLYQPLFLTVVGVLTVVYAARLYTSPDAQLTLKGQPNNFWLALLLSLLLALWLGFRPPYAVEFVDSYSYAHSYENVEFGYTGSNSNLPLFFPFISLAYVLTALWAMTILVPRNPMLGMIFVLGSLMFFTFGVNGIRNGMACHLILLAIAFLLQSNYPGAAIVAAAASSIVRGPHAGLRWDFLLYSAMPVLLGYNVLIKRGMRENWYRVLFNTYCMANAFWVLVIRAAFSNRFAYLSWFLYPAIIAYPLIMMHVWDDQDRKTAQILLAYVGFTIIMNTFYW